MVYPRKDRKPKDLAEHYHKGMDRVFYDKFGWRPRSEGVFVTNNFVTAESYGNAVNIFFPVNGFSFVWSTIYSDLYTNVFQSFDEEDIQISWEDAYGNWKMGGGQWVSTKGKKTKSLKNMDGEIFWEEEMEKHGFEETNGTIWLWEPYVSYENFLDNILDKKYENTVKSYTDDNLPDAIKSGHEIMFKCKYYYIMRVDDYKSAIMTLGELGL
jgi:hypothetical protein